MQDTNRQLTAQNTQSAKDLNEAKEQKRQLEKQLEEALSKNKGCSSGCLGMITTVVSITSLACWMLCLFLDKTKCVAVVTMLQFKKTASIYRAQSG